MLSMDNSRALKSLGLAMICDAVDNIRLGNKYSEQSLLFLQKYQESWVAVALNVDPIIVTRGVNSILSGRVRCYPLVPRRKIFIHPLYDLRASDCHHHGSIPLEESEW